MAENISTAERILGPIGVAAMEKRHLNPETAAHLQISTGRIVYVDGEDGRPKIDRIDQDPNGNIICFPIIERGEIVGEKYRGPNKFFLQKPGSKQVFINGDALDDPSLEDGSNPLVIVEGELDMISAIDAGFPLSVSVPAGAPTPPKDKAAQPEPSDDSTGKFEFLFRRRDRLKKIKRFIIAVDNDAPGQYLAEELVRRLSAARCSFVTYPEGCKDLNDVLMKHGVEAAHDVLAKAKPYPLKGVYSLKDYPERPPIQTFSTGWETIDDLYRPFAPSFTLVSGVPGHGKSTWLSHLLVNLASMHGWKAVVFSPELPTVPQLRDKFRRIVAGMALDEMTPEIVATADRWINANLFFIDHDVIDDNDQDLSLEWLLDRVYDALMRHGIRVVVLDPWNEIEHAKNRGENEVEYTNRAVRTLRKFGKRHGLAIFVVAHPTKDVATKDGDARVPTPYDIAGGAVWFNKPDHIIVVDRPSSNVDQTDIWVRKVRFEGTGKKGKAVLRFDPDSSRYELLDFRNRY